MPIYRSQLTDDELLRLTETPNSLTEAQRIAVNRELRKRRFSHRQILTAQENATELAKDARARRLFFWVWPSIRDIAEASLATRDAASAAGLVSVYTAALSLLALFHIIILTSPGSLLDAMLFAIIAWRIYRFSRASAVAGLILFLVELGYSFVLHGFQRNGINWFLTFMILCAFIAGVRGTFAYHRYLKEGDDNKTFSAG